MAPDESGSMDALIERAKANAAAATPRDPRAIWRVAAGVVGAPGALLALGSLAMPWYTLKNGPTYTGLYLLRNDQFAYTGPYDQWHAPPAGASTICMSGVVSGLSLPIGLMVAACVALPLLMLLTIRRAPRGWWGWSLALAWLVGGWLARFFVYPWAMTLVNVNPYQLHGYSLGLSIGTVCAYPGMSDYGQSMLQVGLLALCLAGLLDGLLFLASARRIARVGAAIGLAAYLLPVNLAPLSFAGLPPSFGGAPVSGLSLLIALVPLMFALMTLLLAYVRERQESTGWRIGLIAACLISAVVLALSAALLTASALFQSGVVIVGPGVNALFLSASLLAIAGIRGMIRSGAPLPPDQARQRWSQQ